MERCVERVLDRILKELIAFVEKRRWRMKKESGVRGLKVFPS
jgi:hypothetical protein